MVDGHGTRATVVVAADDPVVGEVLARIVETAGHEVIRLPDGTELASAVASASASAVVTDLATATADQLRALDAAVRPVAITTGPAGALLAHQAGADAVLTRPFAADELVTALAEVLAADDAERAGRRDDHIRRLGA